MAFLPHKSSPHFLCGRSIQPHTSHLRCRSFGLTVHIITPLGHGFTFDLRPCPRGTWWGQRSHRIEGNAHTYLSSRLVRASLKWSIFAYMHKATPNQKLHYSAHITVHKTWGTPTSLIKAKFFFLYRYMYQCKECFDVGNYFFRDHIWYSHAHNHPWFFLTTPTTDQSTRMASLATALMNR